MTCRNPPDKRAVTAGILLAAATLVIVATALVLCVRDVRTLERRVPQVPV